MEKALFEDFLGNFMLCNEQTKFPKANAYSTDEGYVIELAVAGYSKEDILISFKNEELVISCKEPKHHQKEPNKIFLNEIAKRKWERRFTFPKNDINVNEIKATYENGLLVIDIPFNKDVVISRNIEIE